MRLYATPVVASELAKTVLVTNYYYRVRMEAVRALVTVSQSRADVADVSTTLPSATTSASSYCSNFSTSSTGRSQTIFPLSPTTLSKRYKVVSDLADPQTLITALAELRDPTTRTTWPQVRELLLNLLRSNDNATNQVGWLKDLADSSTPTPITSPRSSRPSATPSAHLMMIPPAATSTEP
jgi:transcription initiation factor TFIID subunit 2